MGRIGWLCTSWHQQGEGRIACFVVAVILLVGGGGGRCYGGVVGLGGLGGLVGLGGEIVAGIESTVFLLFEWLIRWARSPGLDAGWARGWRNTPFVIYVQVGRDLLSWGLNS